MYEKFAQLLQERGITPYRVYKDTGVSQSTLSDWKKGKSVPKIDKLQLIADYFGVPVSYFLEPEKAQVSGEGDPRSVEEILAWTRRQLETQEGLMFDGGVASDEAIESILSAMKIGLEIARSKSREEKQRAAQMKAEVLADAEKIDEQNEG